MTVAPLAKNLTLDFPKIARSHNRVGNLCRIAAITCVVATAIFLIWAITMQFAAPISAFEVLLLVGSFGGLSALVTHLLWKGGSAEFTQGAFFTRVSKKVTELKANWQLPEIQGFFAQNHIQLTTNRLSARGFLPSIAHFTVMQEMAQPKPKDSVVEKAKKLVHKLNAAMILQTMHRPTHLAKLKLTELQIEHIPGIGHFDLISVIIGKKTDAFIFDKVTRKPLTIDQFTRLAPSELRALLFDPARRP